MPPSGWLAGQQHRLEVGLVRTDRVLAERVARPGVGAEVPHSHRGARSDLRKDQPGRAAPGRTGSLRRPPTAGRGGRCRRRAAGSRSGSPRHLLLGAPPKSSPWRDMSHWSCSTTKRLGLFPGSSVSPRSRGHSLIGVNFPARRGRAPAARTSVPVAGAPGLRAGPVDMVQRRPMRPYLPQSPNPGAPAESGHPHWRGPAVKL